MKLHCCFQWKFIYFSPYYKSSWAIRLVMLGTLQSQKTRCQWRNLMLSMPSKWKSSQTKETTLMTSMRMRMKRNMRNIWISCSVMTHQFPQITMVKTIVVMKVVPGVPTYVTGNWGFLLSKQGRLYACMRPDVPLGFDKKSFCRTLRIESDRPGPLSTKHQVMPCFKSSTADHGRAPRKWDAITNQVNWPFPALAKDEWSNQRCSKRGCARQNQINTCRTNFRQRYNKESYAHLTDRLARRHWNGLCQKVEHNNIEFWNSCCTMPTFCLKKPFVKILGTSWVLIVFGTFKKRLD